MLAQEMTLFVEELMCFRNYLTATLHLRPCCAINSAFLTVGERQVELMIYERDGYIELSCEILVDVKLVKAAVTVYYEDQAQVFEDIIGNQLPRFDPFHNLIARIGQDLVKSAETYDVLEIGSRSRALATRHLTFQATKSYTGVDICDGPNVDVVGDAHYLANMLGADSFDFIYSQYCFEHLAMPWVVVNAMNRVLRIGGQALILTNHTIGLHDLPWDYWRFGISTWHALFNEDTGFTVIEAALGDPVRCTPIRYHEALSSHEGGAGYQGSAVLVRKDRTIDNLWGVRPETVHSKMYRRYPTELDGAGVLELHTKYVLTSGE